jgi:Fic family protein
MYKIKKLPLQFELETKEVLKKTTLASRALAELKSISKTIPNESILISTLTLQEAKDSSAVENIITTHDELFKVQTFDNLFVSSAAKEVQNYVQALKEGFEMVRKTGLLRVNDIIAIQETLEHNKAGFRRQAATTLKNANTGEVIYTPPQEYDTIMELMENLVRFINDNELSDLDPLVKMAIIHFQFETIHPFYDGNGRTGRIINILYLILQDLLEIPTLYLSRFIIQNKQAYYQGLQAVRDNTENTKDWINWILFILTGVEQIAKETTVLIQDIKALMQNYKNSIRGTYSFYSQDLLNNLFKYPYTKIEFIEKDLSVSRPTASSYLNRLAKDGLLEKIKVGKTNYYINKPLYNLLVNKTI